MAPNEKLILKCGRTVHIQEIRQRRTYEGLIEGLPTREGNAKLLQRLVSADYGYSVPSHLIQPIESAIDIPDYPFGTPSALPLVMCVARLRSLEPVRGHKGDLSALAVIWFQQDFSFPATPELLPSLLSVNWDQHAASLEI